MAFAEYEGKYYFLIHYQLLDSSQNRLHLSSEGDDDKSYKVWDVSTSTVIANFHLIDCLTWRKYYIHSFVNCRYQLHNSSLSLKMEDSDILQNNNLLKPQMSNMVLLPGLIIMGSSNGDLHVLRASALHYSNMIDQTPLPSEMCVAKTYPAHSSEINQI